MKRIKGILICSLIGLAVVTGVYIAFFLTLSFTALSFEFAWERMKIDFMLVRAVILSVVMSITLVDLFVGGILKK